MAQPPFLVDVIQIEPGSAGTRTVNRLAADGSLNFIDPLIPLGLTLTQLAGLRNVTGVFVVGRAGYGAPYTTIQSAIDAVPDSSSIAAPSTILVLPGVYNENLVLQKDGVSIIGLGGVTISNNGDSDTFEISAALTSTPTRVTLRNLILTNDETNRSCVSILGADAFASGTITVVSAPLAVGDTVTIGGLTLTGVIGTRTSGANNFSVAGGTTDAIAAEIVLAINDPENALAGTVSASSVLDEITVDAVVAGSGGNAIGLSVVTAPVGGLTVSGANLTGGGAAGSTVGSNQILIDGCDLVATDAGGYQVKTDTVNYVCIRGGSFRESSSTSACQVVNTARFELDGVAWANDFDLSYDDGNDQPVDVTCIYTFNKVSRIRNTLCNSTTGTLEFNQCPVVGDLGVTGANTVHGRSSGFGNLSLNGTVVTFLSRSTRGTVTVDGGTPTLDESVMSGDTVFFNSNSEDVVFDAPMSDATYRVLLDSPVTSAVLGTTVRSDTGFTIASSGLITGTVSWVVMRNM